jgi:hypothetical protein
VVSEDFGKSDHRPILIDTEAQNGLNLNRGVGQKKFEAKWLCEESVETSIQTAWDRAKLGGSREFADKTACVHAALLETGFRLGAKPKKRIAGVK